MARRSESSSRSRSYQNVILTVIAAFLGVLALQGGSGAPSIKEASASQGSGRAVRGGGGLANPAQQRQESIHQLRDINEHLKKLINAIEGEAIDVNVISMPAGAASE